MNCLLFMSVASVLFVCVYTKCSPDRIDELHIYCSGIVYSNELESLPKNINQISFFNEEIHCAENPINLSMFVSLLAFDVSDKTNCKCLCWGSSLRRTNCYYKQCKVDSFTEIKPVLPSSTTNIAKTITTQSSTFSTISIIQTLATTKFTLKTSVSPTPFIESVSFSTAASTTSLPPVMFTTELSTTQKRQHLTQTVSPPRRQATPTALYEHSTMFQKLTTLSYQTERPYQFVADTRKPISTSTPTAKFAHAQVICRISNWSVWSVCSFDRGECEIGMRVRQRFVDQLPACDSFSPILRQECLPLKSCVKANAEVDRMENFEDVDYERIKNRRTEEIKKKSEPKQTENKPSERVSTSGWTDQPVLDTTWTDVVPTTLVATTKYAENAKSERNVLSPDTSGTAIKVTPQSASVIIPAKVSIWIVVALVGCIGVGAGGFFGYKGIVFCYYHWGLQAPQHQPPVQYIPPPPPPTPSPIMNNNYAVLNQSSSMLGSDHESCTYDMASVSVDNSRMASVSVANSRMTSVSCQCELETML